MSGIAIILVAYYFGVVSYIAEHAEVFVTAAILLWLLLFVPSRMWAKMRSRAVRIVAPRLRDYVEPQPKDQDEFVPTESLSGQKHQPAYH
ncbi:hypothetical protein [Antrihabitans sp. YC2-6]|uniref:hypothetical protein n=1 Tax=Antrihabitans sp. YC2-6 TaxID=2799498 RepID=UPI0018F69834|nr:hypothetical protein [Antrihabitans sp. YC2-6]MBJ8346977.1 hypothetical protein [Antrihabitans sp. YC2-6]